MSPSGLCWLLVSADSVSAADVTAARSCGPGTSASSRSPSSRTTASSEVSRSGRLMGSALPIRTTPPSQSASMRSSGRCPGVPHTKSSSRSLTTCFSDTSKCWASSVRVTPSRRMTNGTMASSRDSRSVAPAPWTTGSGRASPTASGEPSGTGPSCRVGDLAPLAPHGLAELVGLEHLDVGAGRGDRLDDVAGRRLAVAPAQPQLDVLAVARVVAAAHGHRPQPARRGRAAAAAAPPGGAAPPRATASRPR